MAWAIPVAGMVMSAYGQGQAADAAARAGKAALVAASINSVRQKFESRQQAEMIRERSRREEGTLEADAAARGLGSGGSPATILLDKAYQDELTAQRVIYSGDSAARDIMARGRAGFATSVDYAAASRIIGAGSIVRGAGDYYLTMRPGSEPNYGNNGVNSTGVGQAPGGV